MVVRGCGREDITDVSSHFEGCLAPLQGFFIDNVFQQLAEAGINLQLISTSEIKISVVIALDRADEGARLVHAAFGLDKA